SLNRKIMKAYLLKESLERLWTYTYEGAMMRYLQSWIGQLRWQRLPAFEKLANMLIDHLDSILNHCRVKVRFGTGMGAKFLRAVKCRIFASRTRHARWTWNCMTVLEVFWNILRQRRAPTFWEGEAIGR